MSTTAPVEGDRLPVLVSGTRAPLWGGMAMLIVIEATVFSTLIATYFYLRFDAPTWPPAGIEPPELLLPTVNTFVLLGSSAAVYLADKGIAKGDRRRLMLGLGASLVLGTLFLVLKWVEYSDVGFRWDTHAYGSIVWTIIGFHSAHVLAVVLKTVVVEVLAIRGYFTAERRLGVGVNGLYWHFVALIWLPLYAVLYLSPRWL